MSDLTIIKPNDYQPSKIISLLLNTTPQQSQRQDSTNDQLKDLILFANKLGMYDAADFIKKSIGNENK